MTRTIIQQLVSIPGLKIECPRCNEEFKLKRDTLFSMYDAYPATAQNALCERLERANELERDLKQRREQLGKDKKEKPKRITIGSQSSNFGRVCEHIVPAFLTFPYKQNECRLLLSPVDYLVFAGLCVRGRVETIKFVDVKTGKGRLNKNEQQISDCVVSGKIKHKVIG
jgi:predicted Holliday junction resolvase-like endonuclease